MLALRGSCHNNLSKKRDKIHFTAILCLAAILAWAGVSEALTVSGTVQDQDGMLIEGAVVTFVKEADQTQSISDMTGSDGKYRIDLSRILPTPVSETPSSQRPSEFGLSQNYPNPFNPETIIVYEVSKVSDVSIVIYSSLGQRVRTLMAGYQAPGVHHLRWDARDDNGRGVAAGVYLYQMRAGDFVQTRKMLLLDGRRSVPAAFAASLPPPPGRDVSRKPSALAPLFTINVTGEGFFEYWRSGVALASDAIIDITVNSSSDQGMLRLSLTDAPVDSADAVEVTVSSVQIRREENDPWETFGGDTTVTIDLLSLTGGITELLGEEILEPGLITGVRLNVDSASIVVEGERYDLFIPSGAETGLKLAGSFEIVAGEVLDLTLDFDARRSVVRRGKAMDFLLKPVIRLVSSSDAGSISGRVVVEEGVVLEEIEVVILAVQGGDEVSSAKVDPEDGTYRISYLPAGTYDLKVEKKEGVTVVPERIDGVVVVAGEETANVDFTITAVGGEGEEVEGEEGEEGEEVEGEEGEEGEEVEGEEEVELTGVIVGVAEDGSSITVDDIEILIGEATEFVGGIGLGDLTLDMAVNVIAEHQDGGALLAVRIEMVDQENGEEGEEAEEG